MVLFQNITWMDILCGASCFSHGVLLGQGKIFIRGQHLYRVKTSICTGSRQTFVQG